ncbi:MAG: oxidoreductase domain protein [Actinomycetia bacterium]|nr:oxidoreductase domain protein [Actinomycetes bacterium]
MNVGIIGSGFGARVVAPVFAETDGCTVTAVVSARDHDGVQALVARPDVDLVCVHSPPFLHARDVRLAIAAGKAVLCDKPFALNATEAAALFDEAQRAGVVHLVNFEFRREPARIAIAAALRAGAIGSPEHVSWSHISSGSRVPLRPYGWLFDAARGGGWIGAWASHAVDMLRFLFGEVDEVNNASRRIDVIERPDAQGVMRTCTAEDALSATLTVGGDVSVAIDSGFASTVTFAPRFTVFGSDGAIECAGNERVTLRRPDGSREERFAVTPDPGADHHHTAMRNWVIDVRDAVESGAASKGMPTFADGHACDLVLDQLRAAPII